MSANRTDRRYVMRNKWPWDTMPGDLGTIWGRRGLFTALAHSPLVKCLSVRPKKRVENDLRGGNGAGLLPPDRATTRESI